MCRVWHLSRFDHDTHVERSYRGRDAVDEATDDDDDDDDDGGAEGGSEVPELEMVR
jgi:hypothetical protein